MGGPPTDLKNMADRHAGVERAKIQKNIILCKKDYTTRRKVFFNFLLKE